MLRRFESCRVALLQFIGCMLAMAISAAPLHGQSAQMTKFRPPAVPLITSDPYLSIWSEADRLTDDTTRHWTHHEHPLVSLIRIDGKTYRLMGNDPKDVPALPQSSVQVTPTQTYYRFRQRTSSLDIDFHNSIAAG